MSGYGITSPFPTIDTVLPARNRRVGGDSRVTWLTGSARGAAGRCWSGAARDSEPEEEERRDRSRPNRRHGKAPEALPRTVRTVDADRLERSCRRGPDVGVPHELTGLGSLPMTSAVHRPVCILAAMTSRPNAHDALLGATSELTYARGITG